MIDLSQGEIQVNKHLANCMFLLNSGVGKDRPSIII